MIGFFKNKSRYYTEQYFFLVRDGVQYPRILPIHSRINPFYSRNVTFITQEITNTLLKKFYVYNPRNYEHLTQEILPL